MLPVVCEQAVPCDSEDGVNVKWRASCASGREKNSTKVKAVGEGATP